MLQLNVAPLTRPITYQNKILLTGSCFTEHISDRLQLHKFEVCSNPHGILFNPLSVAYSLNSYIDCKVYTEADLFYLNELWNSWDHHTRFSDIDKHAALAKINDHQTNAATFIREAGCVIITLGSAFQYYLKEHNKPVANNHRAPGQWFEKQLLKVQAIVEALENTLRKLSAINPDVQVIFTISPVRHTRDGVIENNRSKARLIESVHELCSIFPFASYFPAYELIIDILRDYRFYDIDFVHPNYTATAFVWEHFVQACIDPGSRELMKELQEIVTASQHKPRFPGTEAHKSFMAKYGAKIKALSEQHPYLDLKKEAEYFAIS